MDSDAFRALSRILGARAVPDECSDDPRALPNVVPGVAKAAFVRLLRRTVWRAAAPAEE